MARRIDLVRHPDKEGDAAGIYLGNNAQITEKGWREADVIVERLAGLPHEHIMSSEIGRARELAQLYAKRLKYKHATSTPLLNEIDKPQFLAGLKRTDPIHVGVMQIIRASFESGKIPELTDELQQMISERLSLNLPRVIQVKSRRELEDDMRALFTLFSGLSRTSVLCVSHAKMIAAIVHWVYKNEKTLTGFYEEADRALKIDTTGITTLTLEPDRRTGEIRWHILRINDTEHYDRHMTDELNALVKRLT